MSKHKTKEEWVKLFKKYEETGYIPKDYFSNLSLKSPSESRTRRKRDKTLRRKLAQAKKRFRNKYKLWKIDDNLFMKNKIETRGRKKKRSKKEIEKIVDNLTDKELKDIAKRYIEISENNKKKEASRFEWSNSRKAYIFGLHRSTFYKKKKIRLYKFDYLRSKVETIMKENYYAYGSKRISVVLKENGFLVSDRTLRNYMQRWGFKCITRVKRRRGESKNTNVQFKDLVNRDFNPSIDNIVATDVSYIPANVKQNYIYLSAAISHKTKLIESWELSKKNDIDLVVKTIEKLPKNNNRILHSDHGAQYSSIDVLNWTNKNGYKTSMGRVGNSLDNREIEYFFGCLKSEFLHNIDTSSMLYHEIHKEVDQYIKWYNEKRIQKRLQWKTPAFASAYAV